MTCSPILVGPLFIAGATPYEAAMASSASESPVCWVVSDGRAGIENQALGLAEAVARLTPLKIETKRIDIRAPWKYLPRAFWGEPFSKLSAAGDGLTPPLPALWIGAGRASAPLTMAVKQRWPATMTVQTQDPRMDASGFDLVVPPLHDNLTGANVFALLGAPHRVTQARLADDARNTGIDFGHLGDPRVAVLIGGPNRAYEMSAARIDLLIQSLKRLCNDGAGLMITTSRRTPSAFASRIAAGLSGAPHFLFDAASPGEMQNPYFAILAAADHILVTADSVNMATEAAATGKPVQIIPLDQSRRIFGRRTSKFEAFHKMLIANDHARPFNGALAHWDVLPLDETSRAAAEIVKRWRRRKTVADQQS